LNARRAQAMTEPLQILMTGADMAMEIVEDILEQMEIVPRPEILRRVQERLLDAIRKVQEDGCV